MKNLLLFISLTTVFNFVHTSALSQCVWCFTMQEALQDPLKVLYLDLSAKGLNELPEKMNEFTQLQELDLSDNLITEIDFKKLYLPNLTSLKISNNPGFNAMALEGIGKAFPQLKTLNMSECALSDISPELSNLQSLEELNLSKNSIRFLPDGLDRISTLKRINLSYNKLRDQSLFLSQLWQIEEVRLEGNEDLNLYSIAETLLYKDNLKYVSISDNRSDKVLPKNFKDLTTEQLEIAYTRVEGINSSVSANKTIKKLTFNNCELIDSFQIYSSLNNFKSLEVIEFKNMTVPGGISKLKEIKTIILNNCDLNNVDELSDIRPEIEIISINSDITNGDFVGNSQIAVSSERSDNDYVRLNNLDPIVRAETKEFTINSNDSKKIELDFSSYEIPSNAFLTQNGEQYKGEVQLKIIEYNDPVINAISGVPMIYNDGTDRVFSSSGMIDFRAYDNNGNALIPDPQNQIQVELNDIQPSENSDLYVYNDTTSNWEKIGQPVYTNYDSLRRVFTDSLNKVADRDLVPVRAVPIVIAIKYRNSKYDPTQLEFKSFRKTIYKNDSKKQDYFLKNEDEAFLCGRTWKIDTLVWKELDSVLCASKKDQQSILRKMKRDKSYYYDKVPRIITELKITPNMERDNFTLSFKYKDDKISIPIYEDLYGSAERVQAKEKVNYRNYQKKMKKTDHDEGRMKLYQDRYIKARADEVRKQMVEYLVANARNNEARMNETFERLRFGLTSFGLVNCDYFSRNRPQRRIVLNEKAKDQDGNDVDVPDDIRNIILDDNSYLSTNNREMPVYERIKSISLFAIGALEIAIIKGWKKLGNGTYEAEVVRFSTENMSAQEVREKILSMP